MCGFAERGRSGVWGGAPTSVAQPKSQSLTCPEAERSTFSGFTSQCTTSPACRNSMTRASSAQ